ncbi:hypothetical protein [Thiospirillum jenense]|uniref:Uncharacterized protein n=1 Tax=Thiospirillum jenense TaxID=1653858 RepID=A0A839HH82_9GAMM|nr:hypothetical protein [Thiospirillum jenense]MBB1126418.1 hypothetical protein [Thiospirillum jenense]
MNTNTDYFDYCDSFNLPAIERIRYYQRELEKITPPKSFRDQVLVNVYRCLLVQYTLELPLEPFIKKKQTQHPTATIHYLNTRSRLNSERPPIIAHHMMQLNRNQTSN